MKYTFKGRLCGYICDECPEPLSRVKVRLYRVGQEREAVALAVANPKSTFAILSDKELKAKESSLIAESETDANGTFVFELSEKQRYEGGAFEVDVYCGSVPRQKTPPTPPPPLQFSITTLQPLWHQAEGELQAVWEYCLPYRYWCGVRARLGAWTICGKVVDCESKAPIANVKVRAFDVDWWQDDELGSGVTDLTGRFRIDYAPINYKQTPFSPWGINVEWFGGPDLYFRIEALNTATVLLNEAPSRGRDPDRQNRGSCVCVDLCIDASSIPSGEHQDTIPMFTNVGQYVVDPAAADFVTAGFTSDGLTKAGNYAFTQTIPLVGLLPDGDSADALEYHFRVGEYDAAGVMLGVVSDIDAAKIRPTTIGKLQYFYWTGSNWSPTAADFYANHPGASPVSIPQQVGAPLSVPRNVTVKAGGWIEVPTINELFPGGRGRFIGGSVNLVDLDTTQLTTESFDLTTPLPVLVAGQTVPSSKKAARHRFRVFFEARKVAGGAAVSSNDLEKIAISNTAYLQRRHPNWAGGDVTLTPVVMLNIDELVAAGCKEVQAQVHALFTAYHPYAASGKVYIEGPGPASVPSEINLVFSADGEAVSVAGGNLFDISAKPPCAYIMWLEMSLNLTSGYGLVFGAFTDHIAFCKGTATP